MSKFAKWLGGAAAVALALGSLPANAQTPIKFTLDWVFQGPTSPFLVALEKGYYKAEGLDVTMDPGQGSAGAVQRVATGAYQIGFADVVWTVFLARMEFVGMGDEVRKRPALARYWHAMQARPSFAPADIWTKVHVFRLIGGMLGIG